jgi:hypothetical protein
MNTETIKRQHQTCKRGKKIKEIRNWKNHKNKRITNSITKPRRTQKSESSLLTRTKMIFCVRTTSLDKPSKRRKSAL